MSEEEKKIKRDPEQLPQLIRYLLNSNGYETLREALEDAAEKFKREHIEETEPDKE